MDSEQKILAAFAAFQPLSRSRLFELTGVNHRLIHACVKSLVRAKRIKELGTAKDLGIPDIKTNAVLYALPDYVYTPKPAKESKGSGVKAGRLLIRGYVYPGGRSHRGSGQ